MGFKALSEEAESSPATLNKLIRNLDNLYSRNGVYSIGFCAFSDSVVIYIPNENPFTHHNEMHIALNTALTWFFTMLSQGYCIRGGISFGKIYHDKDKNRILGSGLNKAFNLEGVADFPRIIVDDAINWHPSFLKKLKTDFDGKLILKIKDPNHDFLLPQIEEFINESIIKFRDDSKILSYYEYLKKAFNFKA